MRIWKTRAEYEERDSFNNLRSLDRKWNIIQKKDMCPQGLTRELTVQHVYLKTSAEYEERDSFDNLRSSDRKWNITQKKNMCQQGLTRELTVQYVYLESQCRVYLALGHSCSFNRNECIPKKNRHSESVPEPHKQFSKGSPNQTPTSAEAANAKDILTNLRSSDRTLDKIARVGCSSGIFGPARSLERILCTYGIMGVQWYKYGCTKQSTKQNSKSEEKIKRSATGRV